MAQLFRKVILAAALAMMALRPAAADQGSIQTPGPPLAMTGLAAFLDSALKTVGGCFSGTSTPAGTGSPLPYSCWADTSAAPSVVVKWRDGNSTYIPFATINNTTHAVTLANTVMPLPGASALGAVFSSAAVSNQFLTGVNTDGTVARAQPSAANLSNGTTGSGAVVLQAGASLTTPALGVATATSLAVGGATIGSNGLAVTGSVNFSSSLIIGTDMTIGASSVYAWSGRTLWSAPADGQALLRNSAGTDFARLMLGGTTSAYPSIKRNGAGIDFRVADDTAYAALNASSLTLSAGLSSATSVVARNSTAIPAGGTTAFMFSSTASYGLAFGSGAPTLAMAQGSVYLRSDGRPYYNTNGTTGWDELVGLTASQAITGKTYNGLTVTTTTGTLTMTNAKTLAVQSTMTLASGVDGSTFTFPSTSAVLARTDAGQTFTGSNTFSNATTFSAALTYGGVTLSNSVTGTGSMVLSANQTLTGTTTINAAAIGGATLGAYSLAVNGAVGFSTDVVSGGSYTAGSSNSFNWSTRSAITSSADGNVLMTNAAGTSFGLLQLGGTTASFPAIKRSGAGITFRLADDTTNAAIGAGQGAFSGNIVAVNSTAIPVGGTQDAGYLFSSTAHFGIIFGSGAPSASMAQGSIYLRSDGAPYYNTNGTTGWTSLANPPVTNITGLGTGVATALAVNVGSAGAFVTFNGALGTPSSGTLTNAIGLPISTGVSGLGTGVAAALAVNTGSAGAPVLFNGALGTPSSGVATNLTGTASGLTAGAVPASGITGTTLASNVVTSSLTTVGALSGGSATTGFTINFSNITAAGTLPGANVAVAANASGAPSATFGVVKCDGTTITCASGTITAIGATATSITVGTTTIGSPAGNGPLTSNSGTLGNVLWGQLPGTATNDNASAGNVGEAREVNTGLLGGSATVTITIASPAVVTWTSHPYGTASTVGALPIVFSTTGALPTGITAGTTYYVALPALSANTFNIASSAANAISGTFINTSGTQSGTHTALPQTGNFTTGATYDIAAVQLTAGDWDVGLTTIFAGDLATATTALVSSLGTSSATLNQTPNYFGKFPAFSAPFASSGQVLASNNGMARFSLASTTTIYLNAFSNFSGGNLRVNGTSIVARRRR